MYFKVRTPLWLSGVFAGFFLLLTVCGGVVVLAGEPGGWILAAVGGIGTAGFWFARNSTVIRIEDREVTAHRPDDVQRVRLGDGDRLAIRMGRLYAVRESGEWEEIRAYTWHIRDSDWAELKTELERRWPELKGY